MVAVDVKEGHWNGAATLDLQTAGEERRGEERRGVHHHHCDPPSLPFSSSSPTFALSTLHLAWARRDTASVCPFEAPLCAPSKTEVAPVSRSTHPTHPISPRPSCHVCVCIRICAVSLCLCVSVSLHLSLCLARPGARWDGEGRGMPDALQTGRLAASAYVTLRHRGHPRAMRYPVLTSWKVLPAGADLMPARTLTGSSIRSSAQYTGPFPGHARQTGAAADLLAVLLAAAHGPSHLGHEARPQAASD
eukprot:3157591-Rhodomonas_salina.8